jgi:hypothetical protein
MTIAGSPLGSKIPNVNHDKLKAFLWMLGLNSTAKEHYRSSADICFTTLLVLRSQVDMRLSADRADQMRHWCGV